MLVNLTLENFIFRGKPMSTIPNRPRSLITDLLFQKKYNLSYTQINFMAYVVDSPSWASCVDGYYAITTKQIIEDLPSMTSSKIQTILKKLENLELIDKTLIKDTKTNYRVRGIKLTKKGEEYRFAPVNHNIEIEKLKEEIKELKEIIDDYQEEEEYYAEEYRKSMEDKEIKRELNTKDNNLYYMPDIESNEDFKFFYLKTTSVFSISGDPICNKVPDWEFETTFYIDGQHQLAVINSNDMYHKITEPIEIDKFWRWLFENQDRVGKVDPLFES